MLSAKRKLGELSTLELEGLLSKAGKYSAALVPVGSVEPHGPHLPLATDTLISEAAALRACDVLQAQKNVFTLVSPPISYGVTCFAEGFAGAVSIAPDILTSFLHAVVQGLLNTGFSHVCLVNNHLEPAHDAAVQKAAIGFEAGRCSIASPLTRRWARTLSAEFKSGACHAGRYETSMIMSAAPSLVDIDKAKALPDLSISLSDGIKAGLSTFRSMGMDKAYTGSPMQASSEEGEELLGKLSDMIVACVTEALFQPLPDARA